MRLEVKDLHVHYGKIEAIKGVSVVVNEGEIVTLIGANGAGKSTTVEILEGVLRPTAGEVLFKGETIHFGASAKQYRDRVGIQFQTTALQDFLTVKENLRFFHSLYKQGPSIDELVEPLVGIGVGVAVAAVLNAKSTNP